MNWNKLYLYFFIPLVSFSFSCTRSQKPATEAIVKSEKIADEILIPKKIFDTITSDIRKESATAEPVYLFIPLEVELWSEPKGVIAQRSKVLFSNGGGVLDLAHYVKDQGSFHLYFPEEQFESFPQLEHLYFISKAPVKKIDNENFGLGCGKWVDIQKNFKELQKDSFLKLNTTKERYIYTASGYYIFVFRKTNQVYLAHLNLLDSRYKDKYCPEISIKKNNQEDLNNG